MVIHKSCPSQDILNSLWIKTIIFTFHNSKCRSYSWCFPKCLLNLIKSRSSCSFYESEPKRENYTDTGPTSFVLCSTCSLSKIKKTKPLTYSQVKEVRCILITYIWALKTYISRVYFPLPVYQYCSTYTAGRM